MKFPLTAAVLAPALLTLPLFGAEAPGDLRTASGLHLFPNFSSGSVVEATWSDLASDEDGYEFQLSPDGSTGWTTHDLTPASATYTRVLFGPGELSGTHFARVRALSSVSGDSAWSPVVPLTVPSSAGFATPVFRSGPSGVSGSATAFVNQAAVPAPWQWSGSEIPPGMTFDPSTGAIGGALPAPGVYRPRVEVFDGTSTASTFVTLRVYPAGSAPTADGPGNYLALDRAASIPLDLNDHFSDTDSSVAVRIATNLGAIDTILFPHATPVTVENFLNYVDDSDYTDAIFHRSVTTSTAGVDVIQAGLMKPAGDKYSLVPLDPSVVNEPGLPNVRGTIAVAKRGGDPDSGTSQWYFNVNTNSGLNSPNNNGGFTVFGRISGPSLAVMDDIWNRPTGAYEAVIEGNPDSTVTFSGWPTTVVPTGSAPALDELIQISSVTRISPLDYDVTANSNPALGTASIAGSTLLFTPSGSATGAAELSLQVTDLDGNTLASSLTVCVLDLRMDSGISTGGSLEITFDHEKNIPGLVYEVQRSTDLVTWAKVWSTPDGFAAPEVTAQGDLGSRWRLTVEDTGSSPPDPAAAYLRIVVTKSP